MNCLITFAVVFSIIIVDTYGKSFGLKHLKKLSVTEKRTVDVADAEDFEIDSTPPCPVIECVVVTDSFVYKHLSEEGIRPYLNELIRVSQEKYLDELGLNLTLRLIGHISYTNETEPGFIKGSLHSPTMIVGGSIIYSMHAINDNPLVSRADVVVLITGRTLINPFPKPGEEPQYIAGLAFLGTACNPSYKFAILQREGDQLYIDYTASVFIHEVGHLINIPDDWNGKDCSTALLPGKKHYNYCAKKDVIGFLDTHSCFLDHCDNGQE